MCDCDLAVPVKGSLHETRLRHAAARCSCARFFGTAPPTTKIDRRAAADIMKSVPISSCGDCGGDAGGNDTASGGGGGDVQVLE